MFAYLVLLSAFLIEGIGTYVSVIGLSALFAANPVIIALAIALDLGKVVTVSFLYKYWKKIGWGMKTYMLAAALVLMVITSTGCFGYLSGQFQHAISGSNQDQIILDSMAQEQAKLQARKQEMDAQIAKLPDNNVKGRQALLKTFAPELSGINARLKEIDVKLPELKVESVKKNQDLGPITYVAKAFNTDAEHAVIYVIMTIIFVFDPLAVALLVAGNFLIGIKKEPEVKAAYNPYRERTPAEVEEFVAHAVSALNSPVDPGPTKEYVDAQVEVFKIEVRPDPTLEGGPVGERKPPEHPTETHLHLSNDELIAYLGRRHPEEHELELVSHLSDAEIHELLGKTKPFEHALEAADHLLDEQLKLARGGQKPGEHSLELVDHVSDTKIHLDLGRQKPAFDVFAQPPAVIRAVLEGEGLTREVHTKEQLLGPAAPKSELETVLGRTDVEPDEELGNRRNVATIRDVYAAENPPESGRLK